MDGIIFGIPKGSILLPLFSIIFHADLIFTANSMDIAKIADDSKPYANASDIDS